MAEKMSPEREAATRELWAHFKNAANDVLAASSMRDQLADPHEARRMILDALGTLSSETSMWLKRQSPERPPLSDTDAEAISKIFRQLRGIESERADWR